jgi:hypothetical protein
MELTIKVSDKARHILEQNAAAQGQDIKDFVEHIVEEQASTLDEVLTSVDAADFESDIQSFTEGTRDLPPYNGTYSREEIYFDHD